MLHFIIHGFTEDGNKIRPSTQSPDKHWSSMLVNSLATIENGRVVPPKGIYQKHTEDGDLVVMVNLTQAKGPPWEHVLAFARLHNHKTEYKWLP